MAKLITTPLFAATLLLLTTARPCRAGDWVTFAHDPARTGWANDEKILNAQNASNLRVQWKTHVENASYSLAALTAPLVTARAVTSEGMRSVVYVAGSEGAVFALDATSGQELWRRQLRSMVTPKKGGFQGTFLCPNGITSTPVIDVASGNLYVIAPDGSLYGLDLGTGKVKYGPVPFVSPFAKTWSLNLVDGTVYTTVSLGCGNGRAGIYAADVRDPHRPAVRQLMLSSAFTAGIWGRGGAVIGEDGRIYGGTADGDTNPSAGDYSNTVVSVPLRSLSPVDYFLPRNWPYLKKLDFDVGSASPVWFRWKNRNLIAHGFKEGVVYLLDGDSPEAAITAHRYLRPPDSPTTRNSAATVPASGAISPPAATRRETHGSMFPSADRPRSRLRRFLSPMAEIRTAASWRSKSWPILSRRNRSCSRHGSRETSTFPTRQSLRMAFYSRFRTVKIPTSMAMNRGDFSIPAPPFSKRWTHPPAANCTTVAAPSPRGFISVVLRSRRAASTLSITIPMFTASGSAATIPFPASIPRRPGIATQMNSAPAGSAGPNAIRNSSGPGSFAGARPPVWYC